MSSTAQVLRISDVPAGIREQIYDHVFGNDDREVGGVLVGSVDDAGKVKVDGVIAALRADEGHSSVTFTHDAWEQIIAAQDRDFPNSPTIIGWYHSHPGFGIFLSEHDQFIHRGFFREAFHVAYVIDPQRCREGMFGWRGDEIVPVEPETATPRGGARGSKLVVAATDLGDSETPEPTQAGDGILAPSAGRGRLTIEFDDGPVKWYRRRGVLPLIAGGFVLICGGGVLIATGGSSDETIDRRPAPRIAAGVDLSQTRRAIATEAGKVTRYEDRQQDLKPPPPPPPVVVPPVNPPPVNPPPVNPPPVNPPPVNPPPPPPSAPF